jgi:hypothetical protein
VLAIRVAVFIVPAIISESTTIDLITIRFIGIRYSLFVLYNIVSCLSSVLSSFHLKA